MTGKKNRTGVLKRALMDATCAATVTATKPCGKVPKTKLQGKPRGIRHHWIEFNSRWTLASLWGAEVPSIKHQVKMYFTVPSQRRKIKCEL